MLEKRRIIWDFRGGLVFPTSAGASPWVATETSTSGNPTIQAASGGPAELALSADSEVQNLCLSFGDVLSLDIDDIIRYWMIVKISASLDSSVQAAMGLAGARNDAIDSIAQAALFRVIGNNSLVVESDDGTNNNDDVATNQSLSTAYKRLDIDFQTYSETVAPPASPGEGKSDVRFYASDSNNARKRLAKNTQFNMENYASGLQPFFQIQKTSGTATGTLSVLEVGVDLKLPA